MTKKKTKKEEKPSIQLEVANCDQFTEVVTNCDHLENNDKILSQSEIESLILTIRGQQVMIDRDLANLYKVKTKRLNEQVKRNIEKFPLDFCFQLNDFEFEKWRSQFATSNSDKMEQNSPKQLPEAVFPTGCVWDAWTYVSDLVRSATRRIILIDNFVDDRVLSMLTKRADGVTATIHTRYSEQFLTDLKKHNEQYPKIEFIQLPHRHHDRFLIINDKVHFLGASVKDMGAGLCAVTEMAVAPETILGMLR